MMRIYFSIAVLLAGSTQADWSVFAPIAQQTPPVVDDAEWSKPIDSFVLAELKKAGLEPAPPVNRRVWIRRVTYDLIGLPPTPTEVQSLLSDSRSDEQAMADVVDRLLKSPHYGERWARHWLDVVRYADTDGFAIDEERLWLWRYRDYVIRVLNEDRPFDQFIREQIAGDELNLGERGKIAMSYYRLGPWEADNMTAENRRQDYLNDVTSNVGSVFLGLTVGCARCHDHKFDDILQSDFYQLQAFFTPIKQATVSAEFLPNERNPEVQRRYDQAVRIRQDKIDQLRAKLKAKLAKEKGVSVAEIDDETLDAAIKSEEGPITDEDRSKLEQLQSGKEHLTAERRYESKVIGIQNPAPDEEFKSTYVLNNGDPFDRGESVKPGFLSAVPVWSQDLAEQAAASNDSAHGRRRVLANWLTDAQNPLTPRVLVNRVWQYHFGRGIVETSNDFGTNGSGPSHPELLDYLAHKLIEGGWRLKPLHRELVLSRTYRTSSFHPQASECAEVDPQNHRLWRANYRRLESEVIRDAVLAVSGRLRFEAGGPGFFEMLPDGMGHAYPFFEWHASDEDQRRRRSIYMFQRRNLVHPMMEAFDTADLNMSCERRSTSVTAPQALTLFNGRFVHDNSWHLAERLHRHCDEEAEQISQLFWLTLSRPPTATERQHCVRFLNDKRDLYRQEAAVVETESPEEIDAAVGALRDLCLAVLNTNEFLYLD